MQFSNSFLDGKQIITSQMNKEEGNTFLLNSVASSYIWYIDEILIQWYLYKKKSSYFSGAALTSYPTFIEYPKIWFFTAMRQYYALILIQMSLSTSVWRSYNRKSLFFVRYIVASVLQPGTFLLNCRTNTMPLVLLNSRIMCVSM